MKHFKDLTLVQFEIACSLAIILAMIDGPEEVERAIAGWGRDLSEAEVLSVLTAWIARNAIKKGY